MKASDCLDLKEVLFKSCEKRWNYEKSLWPKEMKSLFVTQLAKEEIAIREKISCRIDEMTKKEDFGFFVRIVRRKCF